MLKKIAIASAAAALFSIGQSASAGQTTNSLSVTATVNANCLVTTGPGAISGTYDPVSANAAANLDFTASSIVFKCTKSSGGVTVGIDQGLNGPGRKLKDSGTNTLNYDVYQPAAVGSAAACAYTQAYDTTGLGLFGVAGTNFATSSTNVTVKICGRVPGGQDVPATGAYQDTLTVNVNF